ncbi:MAG TPA: glycosyltransferase family 2 protein [Gammaproteobacteria bacterium]|nr:glycosyltransferase family 2 protein [Gammaproteobacteria bacterium]
MQSLQEPFDVAVVIPTTLRPSLKKAVQSIFEQDLDGRVQIMIGIDKVLGDKKLLDDFKNRCPDNMALTIIDLGYSTSSRHGGLYNNQFGGALRTILTYAANSRYIAYLDDDNWYEPYHLSDMLNAVKGQACAYSLRWLVNSETMETICEDDFVSVGPGKGIFAQKFGGFVDTNCLILDKMKTHMIIPLWCIALLPDGSGEDRRFFKVLNKNFKFRCTGRPSVHYVLNVNRYSDVAKWLADKGFNIPLPQNQ